jgi:drug/metabolite transporter (DMT)-like permease
MHRLSGRWRLGAALALVTAVFWGWLPIALSIALQGLDAYTITWFRFSVAALALLAILAPAGRLPRFRALRGNGWWLLGVALIGIVGNFVLYLVALGYSTPTINQVVLQISPMLLLLGGIFVFRERFSSRQWLGFGLLVVGLLLFFNRRLPELRQVHAGLGHGVALLVLAALVWVFYGLAQKQLHKRLESQQVLFLLFVGAAVVLLPFAAPARILQLNLLQGIMLAFCCVNTVIAYGAFAEALRHWEASRVGAVLALGPLFTMTTMWLVERFAPGIVAPERLNALSVAGALMVVGGSVLCAVGDAERAPAAS